MSKNGAIKLVAGNSNPVLAQQIAEYLKITLTKAVVKRFADLEIFVEIQENVRGSDVFVLQSTSFPANDHLMEHDHHRHAPSSHAASPRIPGRLCPAGPQPGPRTRSRRLVATDHPRRRRPGDDARSPRRPFRASSIFRPTTYAR